MTEGAAPRLLVVDDDQDITEALTDYLAGQGLDVSSAPGAAEARARLAQGGIDLCVLDVMMPGEDGLSLCRWIRATGDLPVILLTARGEPMDKIIGLEIGADDYMAKPFEPRELLARIKTVLRRTGERAGQAVTYAFGEFVLHAEERRLVRADGDEIELTGGEFALLTALLDAAPRVVSRDDLLAATQGREAHAFDRAVDNQVSRLRRKIERDPKSPDLVKTHRGGGYALAARVTRR